MPRPQRLPRLLSRAQSPMEFRISTLYWSFRFSFIRRAQVPPGQEESDIRTIPAHCKRFARDFTRNRHAECRPGACRLRHPWIDDIGAAILEVLCVTRGEACPSL